MSMDLCQPAVEIALQKEGWTVVASPKSLITDDETFYIGLKAERRVKVSEVLPATVYIEVKCFHSTGKYKRDDFYTAVGQYIVYRTIMEMQSTDVALYLAIPSETYDEFSPTILKVLEINKIRIIIVDLAKERVTQWIR
jgi:hypothetical protein